MCHIILKAETIPEVGFISLINPLQSRMDFFVCFLGNENLLRFLHSGIGYKLMPSLVFILNHFTQTDDAVQIFGFKGRILPADIVQHGVMNCRGCIGQELVPRVGLESVNTVQKSQRALLHQIVQLDTEGVVKFLLCASYLICRLSDERQIVPYEGVFRPFVAALRRNTELLVIYPVHHLSAAPLSASAPAESSCPELPD